MRSSIAYRESTFPYHLLLFLTAIPFMLVWLPLLRCLLDGTSYSWGMSYFGYQLQSAGLSPHYLFLVVQLGFYLLLYYSFFWVKNRNIFYTLIGAWFINVFGSFIFLLVQEGDVIFHGDTLGVKVSLTAVIIILSALSLGVMSWVIYKDRQQSEKQIIWGRKNKLWAIIVLAPLPLQVLLLATGEPHGTTDEIGVIITIIQSFLLPFVFVPRRDAVTIKPSAV